MQQIVVVGAGIMGKGIAYVAALGGYNVHLVDMNTDVLQKVESYMESEMGKNEERGFIPKGQAVSARQRIVYTPHLQEACSSADLVIEAVPEVMELKIDTFKQLDQYCPPHTILATNTSSMSPTEIAAQTSRPDQCVAMHFFNPVHKMKLIEIIKGLETSAATVDAVCEVGKQMGKETVVVKEFPGFVVSRMNVLIGNEAMNMYAEGVASMRDIDTALKLGLNHPMGPFELGDLVGLDTRLRTLEYLHKQLGEKYRPNPLLLQYVHAGRLGRKTGKGFYDYN